VSDEALLAALREEGAECWLAPWLSGVNRRAQFAHIELDKALHSLLPYASALRLDREAPTHLSVPSGSDVRIDYLPEGGPVLAVKLQEMFGQQESPAVCGGRCPVVVHLLSPAGRPLQVTRDLAGFWRTGYAAVRAEMRGRYPKHPWPEDPLTAIATRKTNKALARG
jgi:ATP-dependent helicase HrpB